jgi:hypothetical protein
MTPVTPIRSPFLLAALAAAVACAPDLKVDHPFDGAAFLDADAGPLVSARALDGGGTLLYVDATSKTAKTYLDLDQGREMKLAEALDTNGWELAFMRVDITSNGGASNPSGQASVAVVKGATFEGLSRAPATGFQQDGTTPVLAGVEGGWYTYTLSSHGVNARPDLIYVVRSSEGAYFKLRILGYYDAAGTSGVFTLQYAPVLAP